MADKVESPAAPVEATTPKKAAIPKTPKTKKPRVASKATHPPASEMVLAAVTALKEKKGSSLQAIKKYIVATYKVDAEKQSIFIRKYLKSAVASGALVQTKGSGAAGSFKLPVGKTVAKPKSTKAAVKSKSASKAKKPSAAKKAAPKAKKAVAEKKKTTAKVAAKPPKAKTVKPKAAKAAPKKAKAASPKKKAPAKPKVAAKKVAKK